MPDPNGAIRVVLALDFGLRRIGLASGDTLMRSAQPRGAIDVTRQGPDWQALDKAVATLQPRELIVGAPYNADGSENAMTAAATAFARDIGRRYDLPVYRVDERYSSLEAEAALRERRSSGLKRNRVSKADIDGAAAAVILGRWFAGEGFPEVQTR